MSPESCYTTDANSAQIRFHYRATPTIAVILANAGIHLSARTEHGVGKSPYSDKHSKCRNSVPQLSSFSRTRESIYPRPPSSALEKVLTAENIPNAERTRCMQSYHQLAVNALGWIPACARMTSKRRKRQANKRIFGMELSTFVSRKLPHDRREQRSNSFPL